MVGYYPSLCNKKKNWKNWKIKKLFAVATSKFPEFLIDQSNRIWSETFTAKIHWSTSITHPTPSLTVGNEGSLIRYFILFSHLHVAAMFYFFLSSFFLSFSSSGPNDWTQWWPVPAIVGHAGSLSSFIVVLVDSHLAYKCFLLLSFTTVVSCGFFLHFRRWNLSRWCRCRCRCR